MFDHGARDAQQMTPDHPLAVHWLSTSDVRVIK